jgi:predicted GIY-YIG superfamily endonuclease
MRRRFPFKDEKDTEDQSKRPKANAPHKEPAKQPDVAAKAPSGDFESILAALKADAKSNPSDSDTDSDVENDDTTSEEDEDEEVEKDSKKSKKQFWVYLLESVENPHWSYIGYSVNRERRLRQHNGELKCGGAKYTKKHRPWRMVMSITCNEMDPSDNEWWNKIAALQLEWRCKHVSKGRSRRKPKSGNPEMRRWKTLRIVNRPAVERRLNDIFWLLHNRKKWTPNAPEWKTGRSLRIEMQPSLMTPEIKQFVNQCSFWQPTLHPLLTTLPKL